MHIEGFRPEWGISTIYHAWDTPFWLGTLSMHHWLLQVLTTSQWLLLQIKAMRSAACEIQFLSIIWQWAILIRGNKAVWKFWYRHHTSNNLTVWTWYVYSHHWTTSQGQCEGLTMTVIQGHWGTRIPKCLNSAPQLMRTKYVRLVGHIGDSSLKKKAFMLVPDNWYKDNCLWILQFLFLSIP